MAAVVFSVTIRSYSAMLQVPLTIIRDRAAIVSQESNAICISISANDGCGRLSIDACLLNFKA